MSRVDTGLGAQLIVYQTSDSTFQRTWAPAQHASLGAVRAAETGRPVVQAALTGETVAFDARGRLLAEMTSRQRGVTVVRLGLPPAAARTPYDRLGDYVPLDRDRHRADGRNRRFFRWFAGSMPGGYLWRATSGAPAPSQ